MKSFKTLITLYIQQLSLQPILSACKFFQRRRCSTITYGRLLFLHFKIHRLSRYYILRLAQEKQSNHFFTSFSSWHHAPKCLALFPFYWRWPCRLPSHLQHFCTFRHVFLLPDFSDGSGFPKISLVEKIFDRFPNVSICMCHPSQFPINSF